MTARHESNAGFSDDWRNDGYGVVSVISLEGRLENGVTVSRIG